MRIKWRGFVLLLFVLSAQAEVYKWQDETGGANYSDQPRLGAEAVHLPELQTYSAGSSSDRTNGSLTGSARSSDEGKENREYTTLSISQPEPNLTVRNNEGSVAVSARIEPRLFSGDQVVLLLDGKRVGQPQSNGHFLLQGLNRGTHTVAIEVINAGQAVVGRSEPATFHMHKPHVSKKKGD